MKEVTAGVAWHPPPFSLLIGCTISLFGSKPSCRHGTQVSTEALSHSMQGRSGPTPQNMLLTSIRVSICSVCVAGAALLAYCIVIYYHSRAQLDGILQFQASDDAYYDEMSTSISFPPSPFPFPLC